MKTAPPRLSLRHLLPLLFFCFAAVPAGVIGTLLTERAWERELEAVNEQHLQLAKNLAGALSRYAQDIEAAFLLVAADLSSARETPELTALLERLEFKHVCIVTPSGEDRALRLPQAGFENREARPPGAAGAGGRRCR